MRHDTCIDRRTNPAILVLTWETVYLTITSYDILVLYPQNSKILDLRVSKSKSPCHSLTSLEESFFKELLLVTSADLASKAKMFYIVSVASRRNFSTHSLCRISHRLILQTQIISCHLILLYLRPPRRASLIIAHFYKLDSSFTPQPRPVRPNKSWFIIHMIYYLLECRRTAVYSAIRLYMHPLQIK